MLGVLVALWMLFAFNQGVEHRPVPRDMELGGQKSYSVSEEIGDEVSKPRVVKTSWAMIKVMYRG